MLRRNDISGILFIPVLMLGSFSIAQRGSQPNRQKMEQWNKVGRICGKLVYRHQEHKKDGVVEESCKNVSKAKLSLYLRQRGVDCCSADALVSETESGRGGAFSYKVQDGLYWLVASLNGKEHRMSPEQTKNADKEDFFCSNLSFAIGEESELFLMRMVQLD